MILACADYISAVSLTSKNLLPDTYKHTQAEH